MSIAAADYLVMTDGSAYVDDGKGCLSHLWSNFPAATKQFNLSAQNELVRDVWTVITVI